MKPFLTPQLARAAAQDHANRQMRASGRTVWNEDDWNEACRFLMLVERMMDAGIAKTTAKP